MSGFTQRVMDQMFSESPMHLLYEYSPEGALQGQINAAHSQGGGVIRLGPYEYAVHKSMTLKEGVTLVGVPGKTKLIKTADDEKTVAGDYGSGELGPVITLEAGARIVDCHIDLVLPTGHGFTRDADTLVTTADASGTATGRADDNAVVVMSGERARVEGCYIPEGKRRGVVVKTDDAIILNNEIEDDTNNNSACVYINDSIKDTLVVGNWCRSTTNGSISYQASTAQVVSGNLASVVAR